MLPVYLLLPEKAWLLKFCSIAEPISHLANQHQVSRKSLYQQGHKAEAALDAVFSDAKKEQEVLFYLPVTQTWLFQLILALTLICHCSYRGVVELLRDLFDLLSQCGHNSQSSPGG